MKLSSTLKRRAGIGFAVFMAADFAVGTAMAFAGGTALYRARQPHPEAVPGHTVSIQCKGGHGYAVRDRDGEVTAYLLVELPPECRP